MDYVFLLGPEARRRFLRSAARAIGCSYVCLWSYLPHPPNLLVSMDGWYHQEDAGDVPRRLFDAYLASFCTAESRRVPGWACMEGLPYVELGESDLMNSASFQVQRQFYEEAGIKMAVFMRCESGEIEFGMQTSSNQTNMRLSIQNLFCDDTIQQYQIGELAQQNDFSQQPSSSSPPQSLSVGSPECTSLVHSKAVQATQPMAMLDSLPPHQTNTQAYSTPYPDIRFPNSTRDDAAMARAILAVISSSASTPPPPPSSLLYHDLSQQGLTSQTRMRSSGAFKRYRSTPGTDHLKLDFKPNRLSQRIIKHSISLLRRMNSMRVETQITQEAAGPSNTSNQLHHMISERKRREKLNESFLALRQLLPPGSKKDKASVLTNTKNYLITLKAQASELEERNRELEAQLQLLQPLDEAATSVGDSSESVVVQIMGASESTSEVMQVSLRIVARERCDMISLVLGVLECLKEMKAINLKSVDANTCSTQSNIFARATFAIQVKGSDWKEEEFKEAVRKAVDGVVRGP